MTHLPSSIKTVILGSVTNEPLIVTLPPTIANHTQCGPII